MFGMVKPRRFYLSVQICLVLASALMLPSCGGSGSSSTGGGGGGGTAPVAPTALTATAGVLQVSLTWTASSGATSYGVLRSTSSTGAFTSIATGQTNTNYSDTGLTAGTTYYYAVTATNASGTSPNSAQASATPTGSSTSVSVTINVLANRHTISPYIYGGAFPQDAPTITASGLPIVRWGGNGASTYNWQLGTSNADNDYYFEDFAWSALNNTADASSTQFITDVKAAGSVPLMTMVMLPWVAQSAETSVTQGGTDNYHWSFSASQDGETYCSFDQYNIDAGNGIEAGSSCASNPVYYTATPAALNRTYFPLLDTTSDTCTTGNCMYREPWAQAMASAMGSGTCAIPYSTITSCHFYDMDNEIDIWGGTHRDVHPNPTTYSELRDVYLTEAGNLKGWDPQAIRLGWVSCCWGPYWDSAATGDKALHANIDFMPWWLNEIAWQDAVNGSRTLDIFDVHAYPETSASGLSTAAAQALAVNSTRDWWDPTYTSQAWFGTVNATTNQPNPNQPFRVPRLRAMANAIYPGTPLSFTEWNFGTITDTNGNYQDVDFSTALSDVDAYGILGRERVSLASRWTAPNAKNQSGTLAANYPALTLYTRYDGTHGFQTISVFDTNTGSPSLFSSYAAVNSAGTQMTVMVVNKDPQNTAQVQFGLTGFTASSVVSYTTASTAPGTITASGSSAWTPSISFAPYSATLLVITGSTSTQPASEWDLNPDTIGVPAGGSVTLSPKIISGTTNVTLSSAAFDSFEGASACSGTITLTSSTITPTEPGTITIAAPNTPVFCHFSVTGTDGTATQTQGGWIVVGAPAAVLANTSGNNQNASAGSALPLPLTVTLTPDPSGGLASGACILFTASAGSLSTAPDTTSLCTNVANLNTGSSIIAVTNSSGVASVTLTLPSTAGSVTVTAEGPYGLGHPLAPAFSETAN